MNDPHQERQNALLDRIVANAVRLLVQEENLCDERDMANKMCVV